MEDAMKKSLAVFIFLLFVFITSACSDDVSMNQGNNPPQAYAGPDKTVAANDMIFLDGSASADPGGCIISYFWEQIDGPAVALSNPGSAVTQFISSVPSGSVLTFKLTVTDDGGLQATDTCVVTVLTVINDAITSLIDSLVTIPAGSFMMGSADDDEFGYESPVHLVTLQSFDIGKYEVTQAQYEAVMGTNPSYFTGYPDSADRPVEWVSYNNISAFCQLLSDMTGRTITLPSEAQWEYACRAGTTTLYSFGDSYSLLGDYAWYSANSGDQTHPVGTKLPNPWGLYDMHGNIWEFCLDKWHENYEGAPTDGSAWEPDNLTDHIIRGGGYGGDPGRLRSATRPNYGYNPVYGIRGVGFRVVAVRNE
jgi:formylglycine-generating enzyme required for sulfatase activity